MLEDARRPDHLQPQDLPKLLQQEADVLLKSDWFVQRWTARFRDDMVSGDLERSVDAIMARVLGDPDEAQMMIGDIRQGLGIGYEEERGIMSHADLIRSADELQYMFEAMVKWAFLQ